MKFTKKFTKRCETNAAEDFGYDTGKSGNNINCYGRKLDIDSRAIKKNIKKIVEKGLVECVGAIRKG